MCIRDSTLDSLDIADNTIFVLCSDNGPVIDDGYQDQAFELLNGHPHETLPGRQV